MKFTLSLGQQYPVIAVPFFRYVEKQMFLERSDHRRFEIEKAAREKSRKLENK